jgi:hypothetical protein
LRDASQHKIAPATRKALMLDFSRTAAHRLMMAEWSTGKSFDDIET